MQESDACPSENLCDQLLVAAPSLMDPNFRESMVYIASHNPEGAMGMIVNRPIGRVLSDILEPDELPELLYHVPLYFGGPVGNGQVLLALFEYEGASGSACCHLNPSAELILRANQAEGLWLRAFVGYSGWKEGQLEVELARNDWVLAPPEKAVFDEKLGPELWPLYVTEDQRWRRLMDFLPSESGLN